VILCVWEIVQRNCGDRDGREEEEKYGGRNKFLTKQIRVQKCWIRVKVVESGRKTCEAGSPDGLKLDGRRWKTHFSMKDFEKNGEQVDHIWLRYGEYWDVG